MMTNQLLKNILTVALLLTVSGCTFFSPVKTEDTHKYVLNSIPANVPTMRTHAATLLVLTPESSSIYNTTQMAYTVKPFQIGYFGRNEWAATPTEMLQPLLVKSLQNTHYFHAVLAPPYLGHYDYALRTEILQLNQNFTCYPAEVDLTVRAQLIRNSNNRVIATEDFQVIEPMSQRNPYCGVLAANRATAKLLQQVTLFCLRHLH